MREVEAIHKKIEKDEKAMSIKKKAPGTLITLFGGQRYYIEAGYFTERKEGDCTLILIDTEHTYHVVLLQQKQQLLFGVSKASELPHMPLEIKIPQHSILMYERVAEDSPIMRAIIANRSNLVIPQDVHMPEGTQIQREPREQ